MPHADVDTFKRFPEEIPKRTILFGREPKEGISINDTFSTETRLMKIKIVIHARARSTNVNVTRMLFFGFARINRLRLS